MKLFAVGLLAGAALVAACVASDPVSPRRLRPDFSGGSTKCPKDVGGGGEILGTSHASQSSYAVTLVPRDRAHQPPFFLDSQEAGYDCATTEWGWIGDRFGNESPHNCMDTTAQAFTELHFPYSDAERHCIFAGRFWLSAQNFEGWVDWTEYGTTAMSASGPILVETPGLIDSGTQPPPDAVGYPDVVVNSNDVFTANLIRRVHVDMSGGVNPANWSDATFTVLGGSDSTATVQIPSGSLLRIGAWDALSGPNAGERLLVRYLWNGVEDTAATGFANASMIGRLARLHQFQDGCYHVIAMFRLSNGEEVQPLTVPVRVGPHCYYTLDVTLSGSGTVTSEDGGITAPSDPTQSYADNITVTLTKTPSAGWGAGTWGGACNGVQGNVCTVPMNMARSVSATFTPPTPPPEPLGIEFNWFASPVGKKTTCTYSVNVGGGTAPYTVEWFKGTNPTPVGTGISIDLWSGTSSFVLRAVATDAESRTATVSNSITVTSASQPPCTY